MAYLQVDFIFSPAASAEIAYLKTDIPIVYSSDITFALILNYYHNYSNFNLASRKYGELIEHRAISKAAMKTSWSGDIMQEKRQQYQCISLQISSREKEPFRCDRRLPGRRWGRRDTESRGPRRQRLTPAGDDCGEGPQGHDGSAVQQGLDFIEEADCISL